MKTKLYVNKVIYAYINQIVFIPKILTLLVSDGDIELKILKKIKTSLLIFFKIIIKLEI
jgi:hypothetical protein